MYVRPGKKRKKLFDVRIIWAIVSLKHHRTNFLASRIRLASERRAQGFGSSKEKTCQTAAKAALPSFHSGFCNRCSIPVVFPAHLSNRLRSKQTEKITIIFARSNFRFFSWQFRIAGRQQRPKTRKGSDGGVRHPSISPYKGSLCRGMTGIED